MSRVKITVLSDASVPSLVLALLPAFAAAVGIPREDERRLCAVVEQLLSFTLDNAYPDDDLGEIEVTLEPGDGSVQVTVHDWGLPLTSAGGVFGPLPESLAALGPKVRNVLLMNLGSDGKRLAAEVTVRSSDEGRARRHHIEAAPRGAQAGLEASDAIEVRTATPQDGEAIAQLLYENYHLSYVHADFYRPRYLMAALASGELLSAIAVHEGRVVGRQCRPHNRGSHPAGSARGRGANGRRRRTALPRLPAAPALGRGSQLGPEGGCAPPALAAC